MFQLFPTSPVNEVAIDLAACRVEARASDRELWNLQDFPGFGQGDRVASRSRPSRPTETQSGQLYPMVVPNEQLNCSSPVILLGLSDGEFSSLRPFISTSVPAGASSLHFDKMHARPDKKRKRFPQQLRL